MPEPVKYAVDAASLSTLVATFVAWLPPAAALVTFVWGLIRIYEYPPVKRLFGGKIAQPTPECVRTCPLIQRDDNGDPERPK